MHRFKIQTFNHHKFNIFGEVTQDRLVSWGICGRVGMRVDLSIALWLVDKNGSSALSSCTPVLPIKTSRCVLGVVGASEEGDKICSSCSYATL